MQYIADKTIHKYYDISLQQFGWYNKTYIYKQGHVVTLHVKLPHQFAGSGRGKVAFKPDRRWASMAGYCFAALLG